jgi:aldose 1-epimerase
MSPISCGTLPTGEIIEGYALGNANGFSLKVMTYGATVVALRAPDSRGRFADVVLGFNDLAGYLAQHPYFGAIVGRVAGRISSARFVLDGRNYELARNDSPNHLHGGLVGFSRRLWSASLLSRPDGGDSLRLSYRSPDGEEGYPGTLDVAVTYTVTADNAVVVETEAATDRPTPINLTQHSYFNLAGEGTGTIEGHELEIFADSYAPTDRRMTLMGHRESVVGRGNDINRSRRIRDLLPHLFQAHGDLYFVPRSEAEKLSRAPVRIARVVEPLSGRVLTVSTTEDCLQFYTGRYLNGSLTGKSGVPYGSHAGLCLECQGYPDGVNRPELGDIILRPGQAFRRTSIYAFSTLQAST